MAPSIRPSTAPSPPPTEDELNNLYDEVIRGFTREPSRLLNDVRISTGPDDLGAFIEQYRETRHIPPPPPLPSADPPTYEQNRKRGSSPVIPVEKGACGPGTWMFSCADNVQRFAE